MKGIEIITLYYSEQHHEFFPNPMDNKRNIPVGAKVIARQIDSRDAEVFISRMHTKYVKGRKRGQFPTLEIVRLELELFIKLKSYHCKLV